MFMEQHLPDRHSGGEAQSGVPQDVVQFQRQRRTVPSGIAVAREQVVQAGTSTAALQSELCRNVPG